MVVAAAAPVVAEVEALAAEVEALAEAAALEAAALEVVALEVVARVRSQACQTMMSSFTKNVAVRYCVIHLHMHEIL